jgi:hypothetical protein
LYNDNTVSDPLVEQNNELTHNLFILSDKEHLLTRFERNILDSICKNLYQLKSEITRIEALLSDSLEKEINSNHFENSRKLSIDCCRKIMGNLEILPNPSDLRKQSKR